MESKKVILIIIPIVVILGFLIMEFPIESVNEEYYQVGLSGIKKQYVVGEEIIFSLFLKGYGNECGTYDVQLMKGDTIIESKSIVIDCTESVDKDFEFVNIDITTLELSLLEDGEYTAIGEFSKNNDKKIQDQKMFTVSN